MKVSVPLRRIIGAVLLDSVLGLLLLFACGPPNSCNLNQVYIKRNHILDWLWENSQRSCISSKECLADLRTAENIFDNSFSDLRMTCRGTKFIPDKYKCKVERNLLYDLRTIQSKYD